jgi:hypothetical protein
MSPARIASDSNPAIDHGAHLPILERGQRDRYHHGERDFFPGREGGLIRRGGRKVDPRAP